MTRAISTSVTRKDLQFDTPTDPISNDTIDFVLGQREVGRAKGLSAPPRKDHFTIIILIMVVVIVMLMIMIMRDFKPKQECK